MGSSFHAGKASLVMAMCVAVAFPSTACTKEEPQQDLTSINWTIDDAQELLDRGFRDVIAQDITADWRRYDAKYGFDNRCTITLIKTLIEEENVSAINLTDDGASGRPIGAGWNWKAHRDSTGGPIWNPTVHGFHSDETLSWCFQPGPPDKP